TEQERQIINDAVAVMRSKRINHDHTADARDILTSLDKLESVFASRAPRPDAATLSNPAFPPNPFDTQELVIIRECLCTIKTKVTQLLECVCPSDNTGGGACFGCFTTEAIIDGTNQTVIQWLKSIMKALYGACPPFCL